MFSKLSPFRSKRSQKEKHNHYGQINSRLTADEDNHNPKENQSYFASNSSFTNKSGLEFSKARLESQYSSVSTVSSHATDGNSTSPRSLGWFSAPDSKGTQTASSIISDEIEIGSSVILPYEDSEEQFLEEYEGYFEHLSVDNVRKDQYPKLELQRLVYLDYATCPLYPRFQVEQHMQVLLEMPSPYLGTIVTIDKPSAHSNAYITDTCKRLLNIFKVTPNDYTVIYTPGLASCYRLFGEMCLFQKGSILLISPDMHESAQHVARIAAQRGAKTEAIPIKNTDLCIHTNAMTQLLKKQGWTGLGHGLLICTAQSCSSGIRHSLNWIAEAHQNGWKALLDVTNCLPMVDVNLSLYQPEFVVGSMHHILGYPSNVGFLLVRRNSYSLCNQRGMAKLKIADDAPDHGRSVHIVTEGESLTAHTFAALSFGLEHLESVGFIAIQKRVESLVAWLVKTLNSLKHKSEDKPLVQVYGSSHLQYRGSILPFNVLDSTGNLFPAGLVQRLAERNNIFLGICNLSNPELSPLLHQKPDRRTGRGGEVASVRLHLIAVRLSLGPVSTFEDVYRLSQFLTRFRDEEYTSSEAVGYVEEQIQDC